MRFFLIPPFLLVAAILRADELPGHSQHGESFNEGPRQTATLIPGTGKVKFVVSTKNAEAQKFFEQGIGQLHGFWYFESERSFRTAAALDPDCAMAYWGMAMSNVNNEKRAKEFLKEAVKRKDKAGAKDKLWITVLENYYRDDKRDKKARQLGYIRDLENIVHEHPADIEAKAFLVWKTWDTRNEAPISSLQGVDALIDQILAAEPMHPAHHYRIHLWDQDKPARALTSAAKCGQAAPGVAHMWHMPGHTFSKLRRFDDAAWQQEAATRVDHTRMIADLVLPDQIHNYAHNEEWLVRTYNELGRAKDAMGLATSLIEIPRHPAHNTLDKANSSASYGRTRLIDTLMKWELWDKIVSTAKSPLLPATVQNGHEITRQRALGVAAFHLGQEKELAAAVSALEEIEKKEKAEKDKKDAKEKKDGGKAVAASGAKPTPEVEIRKAELAKPADKTATAQNKPAASGKQANNQKPPVINALAELRALVAIMKKDAAAAKTLEAATDIPKDRLARYHLRLGDKKKAEELTKNFTQDLAGLCAKAEVLAACDKKPEAKTALEAAGKAAFAMDRDLPMAKRCDELAKTLGITGEWRAAVPKRTDSGTRPDIASLGPVHWHPPLARPFTVLDAKGAAVTEKNFAGKNTLLCFYLGHDCTHCVEQLNALAEVNDKLKAAGITVGAISTQSVSETAKANEKSKAKGGFPFPLYSGAGLEAFKAYRAYDDFEKMALHAMVLIDTTGHIRWLDVSYQPFTDTKFLLEECQRLLKLRGEGDGVAATK